MEKDMTLHEAREALLAAGVRCHFSIQHELSSYPHTDHTLEADKHCVWLASEFKHFTRASTREAVAAALKAAQKGPPVPIEEEDFDPAPHLSLQEPPERNHFGVHYLHPGRGVSGMLEDIGAPELAGVEQLCALMEEMGADFDEDQDNDEDPDSPCLSDWDRNPGLR